MNFFENFTIDSAKTKFREEYFTSLLAISPLIILAIITYANVEWFHFNTDSDLYKVTMFCLSTIAGFLTYNFVLSFVRSTGFSLKEVFYPQTKIVYYILYAIVIYGINLLLEEWLGSYNSLNFLEPIIVPFADFIRGANTLFGAVIRILIAFNIIVIFFVEVGLLLTHRFAFIPFLIVDEKNPVEAVTESWNNSANNTGLVLRTFNYVFLIILIVMNVYIFISAFLTAVPIANFFAFVLILVIYLYILPFAYTVFGQLYTEVN